VSVEIRPVTGRRELRTFVGLPWRLYRNEPNWVPPLRFDVRRRLDRRRNPFFEHGEAEYFLAWREGRAVGRISAQVDRHLREYQGNRWGQFGFFECEDDPEAATALLGAAEEWLRGRDSERMVGPMDFTTNDECGLLLEGHEHVPFILTPWTHPYYLGLIEGAGLSKAVDAYMWELHIEDRGDVHPAIWEMGERAESEHGVTVRNISKRRLEEDFRRLSDVYNLAWGTNWGFVPLTDNEVRYHTRQLRPVLDENWLFIAEKDGETVGGAITLPDYNQVLARLNGRLLPLGWVRALLASRRIDRVRVFALGVKPEYQHTGVAAKIYTLHFDTAERRPQSWGETGWILETNEPMNRAMEGMGWTIRRRYRFYEKVWDESSGEVVDSAR
jgi:GNAT superfamily N-acetyltransferase